MKEEKQKKVGLAIVSGDSEYGHIEFRDGLPLVVHGKEVSLGWEKEFQELFQSGSIKETRLQRDWRIKQFITSQRKQACQDMIKFMEEKTEFAGYDDDEGDAIGRGVDEAMEAAKEYLKQL